MLRGPGRILLLAGALLVVLLVGGRAAAVLYTDALWFDSLGYRSVFWTRLGASAVVRLIAGALAAAIVLVNLWLVARQLGPVRVRRRYGNLEIAEQIPRSFVFAGIILTSIFAGWWLAGLQFGGSMPIAVLAWLRSVPWGTTDPLFGRDLSFYLFTLPVYARLADFLLLVLVWSGALVLLGYVLIGAVRFREGKPEIDEVARLHFIWLAAGVVLLLGVRFWIGRYGLLIDGSGVAGLGYTDVTARLPAQRAIAALCLLAAGGLVYGARKRRWVPPLVGLGVLVAGMILLGRLYPSLVQKFRVEPNELAREAPYIRWNIEFTRRAFGLGDVQRRMLPYRGGVAGSGADLAGLLSGLPLWDPQPLHTVFNQLQALKSYYQFPDVDSDRYGPPDAAEQVALAVREFRPEGLPEGARTWQTLRLNPDYVRGFGAVLTPTARATGSVPSLWIRGIDPVQVDPSTPPDARLVEPSVYFGETMSSYVVLDSARHRTAAGTGGPGGIELSSLPRLLALAWRYGDKNLLFSGEVNASSRFVFRRAIGERVRELAPFLYWDRDPYPVISAGRIVWMIDGYTVSTTFPLSAPAQLEEGQVRHLHGAVKATVDGVTGTVRLYALNESNPILESYRRVFPGLVRGLGEMPADLRRHLRYPILLLRTQAMLLQDYHLDRPDAFYSKEDVWQLGKEYGTDGGLQEYTPVYATMRLPGESAAEFLLTQPFIARERQNMTALLFARNDPEVYGGLVLLELPREQQIPGPSQVETIIEQDPTISPQLTLWRQAGSTVDLGRLRVVPVDSSLIYVQPVFLSARGSPIPELQRIVASDGSAVQMARTLPEALAALRGRQVAPRDTAAPRTPGRVTPAAGSERWPAEALSLLQAAEERLRAGDYAGFGARLEELRRLLARLSTEQR